MFKREETNFVSANDIDNMMLIMPKSSLGGSGGGQESSSTHSSKNNDESSSSKGDKKKKRQKGETTKKFTSLIVACLKRLFQIGINFFEGKEQELIQMAKQKFIEIKSGSELAISGMPASKHKAIQAAAVSQTSSSGADDQTNLELTRDQEEIVEDFIRRYLKSSESFGEDGNGPAPVAVQVSADQDGENGGAVGAVVGGGAIDKETYQKTKWQRMLYRKIASKRHLVSTMQNLSEDTIIQRIIEIAKV